MLDAPVPLTWMGHHDDLPEGMWEPGWAFYSDPGKFATSGLSDQYMMRDAEQRLPIVVMCPAWRLADGIVRGTLFCIDSHPTNDAASAWDVTLDLDSLVVGSQPSITVRPSIHLVGIWHGWLTDGVLTQ